MGPPIIAVIIPTSISLGLAIILASMSQYNSSIEPDIADMGIVKLRFEPNNILTKCGTISPTKEIGPPIAVQDAHKITEAKEPKNLHKPTLAPSDFASSSPSDMAFKLGLIAKAIRCAIAINGKRISVDLIVAGPRLPTCQNLN